MPVVLPCGRCRGCRLRKSEEWAIRSHCEASLYKQNSFLTLTYDEEHLPKNGSINTEAFQLFIKKLRSHIRREERKLNISKEDGKKIRYLHCAEYGEKGNRPHYHAILYNYSFDDQVYEEESNDHSIYSSPTLTKLWGMGIARTGSVTFESSAYVARYVMKKVLGTDADEHYKGRKPEFNTMSRRSGIGTEWFKKYYADVYPHDFIVIDGKKRQPPKFFDALYEQIDPVAFKKLKLRRMEKTDKEIEEQDSFRLLAKEMIAEAQFKKLKRNL